MRGLCQRYTGDRVAQDVDPVQAQHIHRDYDWELNKVDGEWKIATQSSNIFGNQDLSPA